MIGREAVLVFVIVTTFGALLVLRGWLPNARFAGVSVKLVATPIPLSATALLPAPAPASTVSVAVLVPVLVGVNTTLIWHEAPTASAAPQFVLCVNWPRAAPLSAILDIGRTMVPEFETRTVFEALGDPLA